MTSVFGTVMLLIFTIVLIVAGIKTKAPAGDWAAMAALIGVFVFGGIFLA